MEPDGATRNPLRAPLHHGVSRQGGVGAVTDRAVGPQADARPTAPAPLPAQPAQT
ncbi:hypothetical protein GCM10020229_32850 [Kitasatospora albolonga]